MASARDTDAFLRDLGRRLRVARSAAGLTQEETAARAGIDYKRLQRIEAGNVNVTMRTLLRLTSALGTSVWQLADQPLDRQPGRRGRS